MRYTTVFFSTVGQCPWWCCDTDECGLSDKRCTGKDCDSAPVMAPPHDCPCQKVPISDTKVASPLAGAAGSNPAQLSDNGPAHQIAVLPLAGSPSDNTSQPEMPVTPCGSRWCSWNKKDKCTHTSNFCGHQTEPA
jgi:hypothetical protein